MTRHAKATFEVSAWQEETYAAPAGETKLTRANWVVSHHGDLDGEETVGCLMYYQADGTVLTESLSSFAGSVGGRSGSFVSRATGAFAGGEATSTFTVVPGSGTGDLTGLRGTGRTSIGHELPGSVTFDYDLD